MSTTQEPGFWSRFWSRLTGNTQLKKGDSSYPFDSYYHRVDQLLHLKPL